MTNEEVYQRAYDEVKLRGLSPRTVEQYLGKLTMFLRYFDNRPIETMGEVEIREFLLHQLDCGKASGTVNIHNSALRFIFGAVLGRNLNYQIIPRRRQYREFPSIMSKTELTRFFSVIDNLRDRAMFETVYGAGLRISEVAHLRVQDIDSEQMRIFVFHGKGGKDRFTVLSQRNLELLRTYWKQYRPSHPDGYLFYSRGRKNSIMTTRAIQDAFHRYCKKANLPDTFTVHTLRHCFATHLLESGVEVCQIKELLGHTFIQTTAFYLHLSNINQAIESPLDSLQKGQGRNPRVKSDA
ncbi:tyrosine-type recombinase/integrase [Acetanaerobacterium elongatum]|uniref:Site-specific recombinase XerD n=1 Tax=Acetanaerobacterium elongatum TaxID=258515 RepID=A0A1G9WPA9_9FIRM|nr:site-specific integrase [Acetanaerobacterium elongatum]SDM86372.1 Site-specific recombinase XerD [Acetanaerobacterium elongatum]